MKKIISVLAVLAFTFSFSQTLVKIKSDKNVLNNVYKGGQEKFDKDLALNLQQTGNSFQVTGDFVLNFNVNEKGEVSDVKLLPELFEKTFEVEVKRDLARLQKNFTKNKEENISLALNFSRNIPDQDGRASLAPNTNIISR
ncbi:hypothetical protein ACM40_00910 [Chryseobacterium sp. BLS98]|jgi:hypothetical protein|uniref:hypothetical protein n=1 Tax=Chryseobacterium sp. BLS98 TaxID=885586 RepID=UPI00065ADB22|nr:hypothetical protein [Chryseobacterium sp. BLS98]KMQ63411.1 hypothetical protein ACM40_00910 [Chryseobacterium sp. BLS98]